MLQEFSKKYTRKMWLSMISRLKLNIDPFDLLEFNSEKIFYKPYSGIFKFEVQTKQCLHCRKTLKLGFRKNDFIIDTCVCVKNNDEKYLTPYKLQSLFDEKSSLEILEIFSKYKVRKFKNMKEYWIKKGYSEEDAKKQVSEVQTVRSGKSPATSKGARGYSIRTIEYWIKKGYSEEDAKKQVSEVQVTNGKNWYIKKYGEALGSEKYNNRMEKWLEKMSALSMGVSKVSESLFQQVDLHKNGCYGVTETTVRGKKKVYRVDYLDKSQRKIIEFDGDYWHANPTKYISNDIIRNKTAKEIWEIDKKKTADLIDAGYKVLRISEEEYTADDIKTIQKCKDFLNET